MGSQSESSRQLHTSLAITLVALCGLFVQVKKNGETVFILGAYNKISRGRNVLDTLERLILKERSQTVSKREKEKERERGGREDTIKRMR